MNTPIIIRDRESLRYATQKIELDLELSGAVAVTCRPWRDTRSTEQNARLWAMLTDVSRQVEWFVDGKLRLLKPDDWKHIFSAGLKRHQSVAAGIDGGFVILGQSTSKMTIADMSDLMELMHAFGADPAHPVQWSDPRYQEYLNMPEASRRLAA